jgi:hypothetical protein
MEVEEDYKTMSAKTDCPTREEKDGADSPQPRRAEGKCKCSGDDIVHKVTKDNKNRLCLINGLR